MPNNKRFQATSEEVAAFNKWRESQGLPPLPLIEARKEQTFFLSDTAFLGLLATAQHFGYTPVRKGDRSTIASFLEDLGRHRYLISKLGENS